MINITKITLFCFALGLVLNIAFFSSKAYSDDKSQCVAAIESIKAVLATLNQEPLKSEAKSALEAAKKLQEEAKFKECYASLQPTLRDLGIKIE